MSGPWVLHRQSVAVSNRGETKRGESGAGKDRKGLPPTQIARALQELAIPWIAGHTAPGEGRV